MLRLTGTLEGLDEALRLTAAFTRLNEIKMRTAVEYVLTEMASYAKLHAPFTDRTGNLRSSIAVEMDPPPAAAGTLLAGMKYSVFVELRDGYWVLSGSLDFFAPKIEQMFAGRIKITQPDLDAEAKRATAYYRQLR